MIKKAGEYYGKARLKKTWTIETKYKKTMKSNSDKGGKRQWRPMPCFEQPLKDLKDCEIAQIPKCIQDISSLAFKTKWNFHI